MAKTPIPEARERLQSRLLVALAGSLLLILSIFVLLISGAIFDFNRSVLAALVLSLTFGLLAWVLKAATPWAAAWGTLICLVIALGTGEESSLRLRSGVAPLIALFVLTFSATRLGRRRKAALGVAEGRRGRNAAQVLANLGMAGMVVNAAFCGLLDWVGAPGRLVPFFPLYGLPVLLLAALCEATADTVSSEIGQAFGGTPYMLTTWRKMRPGTNGAITFLGTSAGLAAALVVAIVGMWGMRMSLSQGAPALAGGVAGLFFDSLLGATLERRGWLGNDLVNFTSTLFAVLTALLLLLLFG